MKDFGKTWIGWNTYKYDPLQLKPVLLLVLKVLQFDFNMDFIYIGQHAEGGQPFLDKNSLPSQKLLPLIDLNRMSPFDLATHPHISDLTIPSL